MPPPMITTFFLKQAPPFFLQYRFFFFNTTSVKQSINASDAFGISDDNISRQFHPLQLYTQSRCHIKLLNVPQQIQLVHIRMKYNRAFHLVLSLNLVHPDQSKDRCVSCTLPAYCIVCYFSSARDIIRCFI